MWLLCTQTLYCGNAVHDQLLQVTRASLRLVDAGTRELRREWRPPAGLSIDVAAASASQVRCGPWTALELILCMAL